MALFMVLAHRFPQRPGQGLWTRDTWRNLGTGLVLVLPRLLVISWLLRHADAGLVPLSALPTWAQLGVVLLTFDLARYWLHRLVHRVDLLWRFHAVHHSAERMDPTLGLRMHVVDFLLFASLVPLVRVLYDVPQLSPGVMEAAFGLAVVVDALQHANLRLDTSQGLGWLWSQVFNHPGFHGWHHALDGAGGHGNYGATLVIWDRLFGTEITRPQAPEAYGLPAEEALAEGVFSWQLLRRR